MLISKRAREELKKDNVEGLNDFVDDVLEENSTYMELGSIGPDLPYYESMAKSAVNLLLDRSDKPLGIEQWSYQLHSKDPNVFPLKMIEIIWKETVVEKEEWEEDDYRKFAFVCGYLTHMAADHTIHPLVNVIAGPYYKRGDARERHRNCEVYQDVYIYGEFKERMNLKGFYEEGFNYWCDIVQEISYSNSFGIDNTPVWFRYLIKKSFVEAHAVTPSEDSIENWVDGTLLFLRGLNNAGPFLKAFKDINEKGPESEKYKENINLETPTRITDEDLKSIHSQVVAGRNYESFFNEAVKLSCIYIKAAYKIYCAEDLDDNVRDNFKKVVRNADLGTPLEKNLLEESSDALKKWG
jgi:hypothetical protein